MTRRRRRILIALAVAVAAIVSIGALAAALVPPWLRGAAERIASRALGRDLKISGPFEIRLSTTPGLEAGDITLANVPWGSEPTMVRVGRVAVSIDLASLWSGPVRILDLEIEDVRVLLEADAEGRGNWQMGREPSSPRASGPAGRPPVVFDRAAIHRFELSYRPRPDAAPFALGIREFEARLDPETRMVRVLGDGQLDGAPWRIAGRLGTLDRLYAIRDVEQAITARLGESRIEIRGRLGDPLVLGDPDLEFGLESPDIVAALGHVGLRSPLTGPLHLRGRLSPSKDGVHVDLEAGAGGVRAEARGEVRAIPSPDRFDVTVGLSGEDASAAGAWLGVRGLPPRPFDLSARLRRENGQLLVQDATVRVGPTSVAVAGTLGLTGRGVGTDLTLRATGPDLSQLSPLARLDLPAGPFEAGARLLRRADGIALEGAALRSGDTVIRAGGALGEPPDLAGLDVTIEASGPDLAWFSGIATVDLPRAPFEVRGRIARDGPAFRLEGVTGRLGDDSASVSGRVVPVKGLAGTDIHARLAGPDLSKTAERVNLRGVPAEPFEVEGRVRVVGDGYELEGVSGKVGRVAAAVEGRLGAPPALEGTSLWCRAEGPGLPDLAAWGLPANLPADPFTVTGRLRVEDRLYRADGLVASVGPDRVSIEGVLGALPDLTRIDVAVEAAGPSVAGLGRFFAAAGREAPGRLPTGAYVVSGRFRRAPSGGYELRDVRAKAAELSVRVEGTVGAGEGGRGTDLRFAAEAPDASLLADLAGIRPPRGAFDAQGRIARAGTALLLDGVTVAVGDARAAVSGSLGAWPGLDGTDLRIDASGADLAAVLAPIAGLSHVPAEAFEFSAEIAGRVDDLVSRRFAMRLGASDLEGTLSMRLGERPAVEADLRSKRLDVAGLLFGFGEEAPAGEPSAPPGADAPPRRTRLISDEPLRLGVLRDVEATVRLEAAEMALPGLPLRGLVVAGELRGGALRIERIEGTGFRGGRASGSFSLEPFGEGYRLRTRGRLDGVPIVFSRTETSAEGAPSADVEFDLRGDGRSLHEIAASGEGRVLLVIGSGRIPTAFDQKVSSSMVLGLLNALNPFRESSRHTEVECAIGSVAISGGKAVVEPIAVQTDRLTVVGRGKVDFDTEAIDLVWTLKPRTGVGLSPGSIANPFVKVGGTLASPSLDMKPLEAAASTGAAVATAGLTVLFKGLYDRITAEKKVCVDALEKSRERQEAPK